MPTGCHSLGLPNSVSRTYLLLVFLHTKFGSLQLKMLIDLGVDFKDSKGKDKVILTILLEIMYSGIVKS